MPLEYTPEYEVCEDESGPATVVYDQDKTTCSVVLRVPWGLRNLVPKDLMTNRRKWPEFTTELNAPRVRTARVVGTGAIQGNDGQVSVYDDVLIAVEYDNAAQNLAGSEGSGSGGGGSGSSGKQPVLWTESLEPVVTYMTLDWRKFKWTDANGPPIQEGEAPGRPMYQMGLIREFEEWYPPLPPELLTLQNCVNVAEYVSPTTGLTFPAETLLFTPPSISYVVRANGLGAVRGKLTFMYKPEGWNVFWRAATKTYQRLFSIEGNAEYYNFPLEDFTPIIDVEMEVPDPPPAGP